MIILLSSLLFSFSSQAIDTGIVLRSLEKGAYLQSTPVEDPFPNKKAVDAKMDGIYKNLAKGAVPQPGTTIEIYSGECVTSYSAAKVPQNYRATVAIESDDEGVRIAYTTGQGGKYTPYTAADLPALEKRYKPKTKPYVAKDDGLGGEYLDFTMAPPSDSLPEIHAALSVDKNDKDKMYFIAMLMGYYCELNRVK